MTDTKITLRPDAKFSADLDALTGAGAASRARAIRSAVHAAAKAARLAQAAPMPNGSATTPPTGPRSP